MLVMVEFELKKERNKLQASLWRFARQTFAPIIKKSQNDVDREGVRRQSYRESKR